MEKMDQQNAERNPATVSAFTRQFASHFNWGPEPPSLPLVYLVPTTCLAVLLIYFVAPSNNELNAQVIWETLAPGISRMAITNESNEAWTDVRIIVDDRFYYTSERVEPDRILLLTTAHFKEGHVLPRAHGLFPYERGLQLNLSTQQAPGDVSGMPPDYQPESVIIASEQGLLTSPLHP
jgi:hypothetical protein